MEGAKVDGRRKGEGMREGEKGEGSRVSARCVVWSRQRVHDRHAVCGKDKWSPYQLLCQSAPAALVSSARNTVFSHEAHLFDVICEKRER
jgi:hypothetical protein